MDVGAKELYSGFQLAEQGIREDRERDGRMNIARFCFRKAPATNRKSLAQDRESWRRLAADFSKE